MIDLYPEINAERSSAFFPAISSINVCPVRKLIMSSAERIHTAFKELNLTEETGITTKITRLKYRC